jgi:hypothetical protein
MLKFWLDLLKKALLPGFLYLVSFIRYGYIEHKTLLELFHFMKCGACFSEIFFKISDKGVPGRDRIFPGRVGAGPGCQVGNFDPERRSGRVITFLMFSHQIHGRNLKIEKVHLVSFWSRKKISVSNV